MSKRFERIQKEKVDAGAVEYIKVWYGFTVKISAVWLGVWAKVELAKNYTRWQSLLVGEGLF